MSRMKNEISILLHQVYNHKAEPEAAYAALVKLLSWKMTSAKSKVAIDLRDVIVSLIIDYDKYEYNFDEIVDEIIKVCQMYKEDKLK